MACRHVMVFGAPATLGQASGWAQADASIRPASLLGVLAYLLAVSVFETERLAG